MAIGDFTMDTTIIYELRESADKAYSVEEFLDIASDLISIGSFSESIKEGFAEKCFEIVSSAKMYTVYDALQEVEMYLDYEWNDM